MKRISALVILLMFISIVPSFSADLVNEDQIVENIAKSITEHPELWLDTGSYFVHGDNVDEVNRLRGFTWPRHEAKLILIYNFYTTFEYAKLEKPFDYDFEGERLQKLIKAIKMYKLNTLNRELGFPLSKVLDIKPEPVQPEEKVEKEETDFNKL